MTGVGSPCGACKFLRRKCVRGCVFAPYFSHDQGAAHFAAIHKVFGASNVSKLLAHLPVSDRCEAAVSISYEAQARLHDPIYGCVSHIFALQQQVVSLQAQLASLKAQANSQGNGNQGLVMSDQPSSAGNNPSLSWELMNQNLGIKEMFTFVSAEDGSSCSRKQAYSDMEDLQSVAFAYLHRS
ncbi:LOB domain-containing protein 29 [Apostasia shenzhenica]|uniref:LOB domain-containing protein 29 n=1 Tax=Apostasia shenzhenica TaxID=1088818 RepID=A0A2I0ATB1_9ASPA|nr:LOB domain-containing protein 29 [Apostasia shenzhenica]